MRNPSPTNPQKSTHIQLVRRNEKAPKQPTKEETKKNSMKKKKSSSSISKRRRENKGEMLYEKLLPFPDIKCICTDVLHGPVSTV